jgi:hypothetical protein
MSQNIAGYQFREICTIIPELDVTGIPVECMPQSKYKNLSNLPLHQYGKGPFCRFGIPSFLHQTGVYAVLVDEKPKYIGECEDLAKRWNMGYGNISPRNCFEGGQPTNCKINNLILNTCKSGSRITLLFHSTNNRFEVESNIIGELSPDWNHSRGKTGSTSSKEVGIRGTGKYRRLQEYLAQSKKTVEELTYTDIERILEERLPQSAYRHRPWWANSGQPHSKTWADAGWKVISVELGESIKFKKMT